MCAATVVIFLYAEITTETGADNYELIRANHGRSEDQG